jgi:glycosyltransferase involved in cell wall biosynthesis
MYLQNTNIVIATYANPNGSCCGVRVHTHVLYDLIINAGIGCTEINPFSGSKKWLPIFAVRPLILRHVNKDWSTCWYRYWHFLAIRENLQRYLKQHSTNIVIAEDMLSALAALDARANLKANFKVILCCHFVYSEASEWRIKGELSNESMYHRFMESEVKVFQAVDKVVYVSNWARQMIEKDRGIQPQSSTVIWNGISDVVPTTTLKRKDFGLTADDLIFISIGAFDPNKNQVGLIDLFAQIRSKYPQCKLLLVGHDFGNGSYRHKVQQKITQNDLHNHVKLLGLRSDVPDLLQIADIHIHCARLESFGIVFLEAARAKIPSIAVLGSGITEVSDQLKSIIAIPGDNMDAALNVIEPIITNPILRTELGNRGYRNFQKYFTREIMREQYLHILNAKGWCSI